MTLFRLANITFGLLSFFLSASLFAQNVDLDSEQSKTGYSLGANVGISMVSQGILNEDIDVDAFLAGINDSIKGNLQMTEEEIMATLQSFVASQQAKAQEALAAQAEEGVAFLEQNGQREGVMTTASGLQYEVLESGNDTSASSPSASDTVTVHYHGTLIDGTVFDSSMERGEPATFPLNGVISGWTEGLQLMKVGDTYRFFIPSDLAYGDAGAGGMIGPNATLIFDVELIDVE